MLVLLACALPSDVAEGDSKQDSGANPDTGTVDTATSDTDPSDTDTANADTADTGTADTGTADTDTADTGTPPGGCDTIVSSPGDLLLTGGAAAEQLDAFCASANAIEGDLVIHEAVLTDLRAAACLCAVGGAISIVDNVALTSLEGLDNLNSCKDLTIEGNPLLIDSVGLGGLQTIQGEIRINTNGANSYVGLSSLTTIDGDLEVPGDFGPKSTEGLETLTTVTGALKVTQVPEALTSVVYVGSLLVWEEGALAPLAGLQEVGGELELLLMPVVDGLDALHTVGGDFVLEGVFTDGAMVTVAPNLSHVGGDFVVNGGDLRDCDWPNLAQVDGEVRLASLDGPPNLMGFSGLRALGGLYLLDVADITSLDGLDAITALSGDLTIKENPALSDVTALYGVGAVGGDFTFIENGLSEDDVLALQAEIGTENIAGSINIFE